MARPNRIPEKAAARNTTPDAMVLVALQQHGSILAAARSLGISFQSLWDYVHPKDKSTGQRKSRFIKTCKWTPVDIIEGEFTNHSSISTTAQPSQEK